MKHTLDLSEASFLAEECDLLGTGDDISCFEPQGPDDGAPGPGQLLLAVDNGCSNSYALIRTKEELRRALQAWLRRLGDGSDSEGGPSYPLCTLSDALRGYGVRLGDADAGLDVMNDEGRFLLVERHTGLAMADQPYWFSRHKSLQAARDYNENQDCAEDWAVDSIFELAPE
ncbi:MAG TPA: hypothetical protein VK425_01130 [Acidimicrobiales bacterium]|nr:hypothetical protein [Acidimicrobiales bacterium]